jgi:hypothetical protein
MKLKDIEVPNYIVELIAGRVVGKGGSFDARSVRLTFAPTPTDARIKHLLIKTLWEDDPEDPSIPPELFIRSGPIPQKVREVLNSESKRKLNLQSIPDSTSFLYGYLTSYGLPEKNFLPLSTVSFEIIKAIEAELPWVEYDAAGVIEFTNVRKICYELDPTPD